MDTLMNTPSRLSLVATLSTFLQGQSLGKDAPQSRRRQPRADGEVVEIPELGALHHHDERRAA